MSAPVVSILMTTYNREKYVGVAICSVLSSTFPDWELIITDDGSTDGTIQIIKEYASKDKRIHVFINEINLGDYPNRNKAASYAKGKYIKYVDADDYLYPWGLELLIKTMEQFPDAGWGLCSLVQYKEKPFPFTLSPKEAYFYHYSGPGLFHKAPLSSIIKRSVFEAEGGFSPHRMTSDFEMWHRLALRYPVVLMPDGIVWYREHGEQEIVHYRKFIAYYEKITIKYLFHNDSPFSKPEANQVMKKLKWNALKMAIKSLLFFKMQSFKDSLVSLKCLIHAK